MCVRACVRVCVCVCLRARTCVACCMCAQRVCACEHVCVYAYCPPSAVPPSNHPTLPCLSPTQTYSSSARVPFPVLYLVPRSHTHTRTHNHSNSVVNWSESKAAQTTSAVPVAIYRMHTCIHAIHVYMQTCTHAHIHTCTHAYVHTCIRAHMHTCTHACMHVCACAPHTHTHTHTRYTRYLAHVSIAAISVTLSVMTCVSQ